MTIKEITKTRTRLGVSQKQVAKLMKKHPTFMSKLENGKRILTPEIKAALAAIFKKIGKAGK